MEGKLTTANRSGIRGVFQDAKTRKWRASGSDKGRTVFLGNYDTKEEAIEFFNQEKIEFVQSIGRQIILYKQSDDAIDPIKFPKK